MHKAGLELVLGAYDREDQLSNRFISDEISQNRITSTWIPAVFLGVAAFLLHIVLTRLTAMQRTQIALLKDFGIEGCKDIMTVEDYFRLETHSEAAVQKLRTPAIALATKILR